MEDKKAFLGVKHPKIRELLQRVEEKGYLLKEHPKNQDILNVFCPTRKRNIIGDIHTQSENGYFTLQRKMDNKWVSFRTLDFSIDNDNFVVDVLEYIRL